MPFPLFSSQIERLCDGTQYIKQGWTAERRAEVVVDGKYVHEEFAQASPFELWESVRTTCAPVR